MRYSYYKEINGETIFFDGIIRKNGRQIINPTKEQILANGWKVYIPKVTKKNLPDNSENL